MRPSLRLAPSILSADFARLGEETARMEQAGVHQIHVDVMDGHFVPNLSMGPVVVEALKRSTRLPLDVHLMITDPLRYLEPFVRAGASHVSFHLEAQSDARECIRTLRGLGAGVGLAISPDTPPERAVDLIPLVDMILVMTVHPGFGGQDLIPSTLEKIPRLRAAAAGRPLDVEVDGGIGPRTIRAALAAGANVLVAGNSVFGRPDPVQAARELLAALREAEGAGR